MISEWKIVQLRARWFVLLNPKGKPVSYHRTVLGALRARREILYPEWEN